MSASRSLVNCSGTEDVCLELSSGEVFAGRLFGDQSVVNHLNAPVAVKGMYGELVFVTSNVGYIEILTDPSYSGQIVVFTSPLIGNYGVPDVEQMDDDNLPKYVQSLPDGIGSDSKYFIRAAGVIVSECSKNFSHYTAIQSLSSWLETGGVWGIEGIDTRRLVQLIRDKPNLIARCVSVARINEPVPDWKVFPSQLDDVVTVCTKSIRRFKRNFEVRMASRKLELVLLLIDCGTKVQLIRELLEHAGRMRLPGIIEVASIEIVVIPFDYDLRNNPNKLVYHAVVVSNGPGDPLRCAATIHSLSYLLSRQPPMPILGICLGHQLLALAAGGETERMAFGHRGSNHPCMHTTTGKCYITTQNHGYVVARDAIPVGWLVSFSSANDYSVQGLQHISKPFFSVQFHPEGCPGPNDTTFVIGNFVREIVNTLVPDLELLHDIDDTEATINSLECLDEQISRYPPAGSTILLIGSGGLTIGQGGEFDYSGSQAIKALKESGMKVILVNPNIATVQASQSIRRPSPDKIFCCPINCDSISQVIEAEQPWGIIISMGGQTALNVGLELNATSVLTRNNCRILGTPIKSVIETEDREQFCIQLGRLGIPTAPSRVVASLPEAQKAVSSLGGYPVLIRAAFALGGLGSGFVESEAMLREQVQLALSISDSIILDKDLRGWKEVEYEVVRDDFDNCITVCNMENVDPLGVHTGDSVVVAPSQTLTNAEVYNLREISLRVIRYFGIVGECNIQFALDPMSASYFVIEVNARLSRSSALASKATGFPLAYVATKLILGESLISLRNGINNCTSACFEPAMDYIAIKVPRWDTQKFGLASTTLGSNMTSIGEVMSVGRNFEEAIQKAFRMVSGGNYNGLESDQEILESWDESDEDVVARLQRLITLPSISRFQYILAALEIGFSVERIHLLSKIDSWFISKLANISKLHCNFRRTVRLGQFDINVSHMLYELKLRGFSDVQIGKVLGIDCSSVRQIRQAREIVPITKRIDTLAAECPAMTNYFYLTYGGMFDDLTIRNEAENVTRQTVMVLGCGPYSIGSSVEFDWCAVSCVREIRAHRERFRAVVVNCNPETVSTDYDESDALYFEELSTERILDIYQHELAFGVIICMGGQTPNNICCSLHESGARVLGTSPDSIHLAEDRQRFSCLLDSLHIKQPKWGEITTLDDATRIAELIGYPVLTRPSFVLSGASMRVSCDEIQLEHALRDLQRVAQTRAMVITKYILNAKEIEFDGVASNGVILNYAISEHVENAGVHSGDATLVLPAQRLYVQTVRAVRRIAVQIAKSLSITGPFNLQLMAKDNEIMVIECNLRASRTLPFVSKVLRADFIALATRAILKLKPLEPYVISLTELDYVAVKAPMFSFRRIRGADPTHGVEMCSTGEVACFGVDLHHALVDAMLAASFVVPRPSPLNMVLVSVAEDSMRQDLMNSVLILQKMGYKIAATPGTEQFYSERGIRDIVRLEKPDIASAAVDDFWWNECETPWFEVEDKSKCHHSTVIDAIRQKSICLLINISDGTTRKDEITVGYYMRRVATDIGVPLLTNIKCANLFCESLAAVKETPVGPSSVQDFYDRKWNMP